MPWLRILKRLLTRKRGVPSFEIATLRAKVQRVKLLGLVCFSTLSVALLLGCVYATYQISMSEKTGAELRLLADSSRAVLQVDLGAMDTIVDKDEGAVHKDRLDELNQGFAFLNETTLKNLADVGVTKNDSTKMTATIAQFQNLILKDLVSAVTHRASPETFAKLDDSIDQSAGNLQAIFTLRLS